MAKYILMHKDDKVANLELNQSSIFDCEIIDNSLMPVGTEEDILKVKAWWNERAVPKSRLSYLPKLKEISSSEKDYLLANLGISMNDHYWLKPIDSDYTWKEVSPFSNEFKMGHLSSTSRNATVAFSPNASLQGEMYKRWICDENKKRILIKRYDLSRYSIFNEIFATSLYEKLNIVNYVKYWKVKDSDKKDYCACETFTSEEIEFIPAWDICDRTILSYSEFLEVAHEKTKLDIDYIKHILDIQTMVDFIITNRDRHLNNFGFLRNSETLEYIGLAPIFDNDRSFLKSDEILQFNGNITTATALSFKCNSFKSRERDNLKRIDSINRNLIDISKLPTVDEVMTFYSAMLNSDINSLEVRSIAALYKKKVELFDMWQEGKSLGIIFESSITRQA